MQYVLSKQFEKDFKKLPKELKNKTIETLGLFVEDPDNKKLRIHPLRGRWIGHYSIDIANDTRAIYFIIEEDLVRFIAIGSHSELYG